MSLTISLVTCSYNQGEFLESTLRSVLDQGYTQLEYIVIDGGSTDGSLEILERYRAHLSYLVSEPDGGHTNGLVKGFSRATGDILGWLNSDDLLEPGALQEVADYFTAHPEVEFVYGDATWIDRAGTRLRRKREIGFNRFIWLHDYNYIPQPSAFWRRELYERVGGLDPTVRLSMDGDLWIRFAEVTQPRHVPRMWSRMRYYPQQRNRLHRAVSDAEDVVIRQRHGFTDSPGGLKWWLKRISAKCMRVGLRVANGCYWR